MREFRAVAIRCFMSPEPRETRDRRRRDRRAGPVLSIVTPTYNERENLLPLVQRINAAMGETRWELIVVDDDSPDGTAERARGLARQGYPVRCLRRIGRNGLASAVVEGALAASAPYVAVIDADLQHDETLLPAMLRRLETGTCDIVIGSRHAPGGDLAGLNPLRRRMSDFATLCSRCIIGASVSDPMSGFFALRADVLEGCVYDLSQQGYKILLDVLASSGGRLRVAELPYRFASRNAGASKLDGMVMAEFAFLLLDKATRGLVPPAFAMFCLVGSLGFVAHLAVLNLFKLTGASFLEAQGLATWAAMTLNFVINNETTYRRRRLSGWSAARGYLTFCLVCMIGAVANIGVASLALQEAGNWSIAGIAGAVMGAAFNFGLASKLVWGRPVRRKAAQSAPAPVGAGLHLSDA